MTNAIWTENIRHEVAFWEGVIRQKAAQAIELRRPRILDHSWVRDSVQPEPAPDETIHLLDVGSGPFSTLGAAEPGSRIDIVQVDALGDAYNQLLDQYGLTEFPRISPIKGEELSQSLGQNFFHLVNCANALDHFEDPIRAFVEMMRVCKGGGIVRLISIENEGERQEYEGLHQWNLQAASNGIWLWNKTRRTNLLSLDRSVVGFHWKYADHGQAGFRIFEAIIQKQDSDILDVR